MSNNALISVRVEDDLAKRLERLAKATDRSKSYLAAQAIEEYVALQEWQVQAIQKGVAAAKRGDVVSHDKAIAELKRWGKRAP
ncbi:MAG: ribbon-helix-helix protein, CopG family [Gammaproteobacteria bacterium]|jgi:predicted transcriptional regulator|nr:ribbon-helix-helix protein, CopG family [Gammaproteobacteria bacterium]